MISGSNPTRELADPRTGKGTAYGTRPGNVEGQAGPLKFGAVGGLCVAPCGTGGAHDLRRTCAKLCRKAGGDLEQIRFLLGHASIQTTERYLGSEQEIAVAVNDNLGL